MKTFTQFSKLLCIGIALFEATSAGNAQTTLTFDDISTSFQTVIPNGYGGLNWNNWFVVNTLVPSGLDYANGVVSSPNVAADGGDGSPASFSSSTAFTLNSAYLMPLGGEGSDYFNVYGYSGGTQVYANSYFILANSPTLINFDYANIDTVQIATDADVPFTMDNMTITVPEPSACALASLAVAFGGLMSRQKKSRSE